MSVQSSRRPRLHQRRQSALRRFAATIASVAVASGGLSVALATQNASATDDVRPIVSYSFDNDSGTTVADSSGQGNDGVWKGTPAYVDGVTGKAASVSSGKNYVKLPLKDGATDASGDFSYEFWMNEESRTSYGPIVSNQNFVSCNNPGITLYNQAAEGELQACWGKTPYGERQYVNGISDSLLSKWHHVAVAVDRADNLATFYVDGAKTTTSQADQITSATTFESGLAFNIGGLSGSETDTGDGYVNASIDNFTFYNAAISANQVSADFAATNPNPVNYTLAFDGNGADAGSTPTQSLAYGAPAALNGNGFSRAGYVFAGWSTESTGAAKYNDKQVVSNLADEDGATVTLYAVWNRLRADGDTAAPIVSYDFDADTRAVVSDSSGNEYNGTWTGTPEYGTGLDGDGKSMRFSSGSNFTQLPLVNGKTDGSSDFSFVFWLGQQTNTGDAWVFTNLAGGVCNTAGLGLYNADTSGSLTGCFGQTVGGTREYQTVTQDSVDNAWHQIAGVVDRTANTVTWYVDGEKTATSTAGAMTADTNLVSGNPFTLGQNSVGSYGYSSDAWVDDFDFYDQTITADQVRNDYNVTKPSSTQLPNPDDTSTGDPVATDLPDGFVSDTFRIPDVVEGASVSQPTAGLWHGDPATSFEKTGGADWLTVSADGTVAGTAPATAPEYPDEITISATNGTTTSAITVEVPVRSQDTAPRIEATTWNLWDAGSHVDDSEMKNVKAIIDNGLSVIGFQEDDGTVAKGLADALGWHSYEDAASGIGIVSAWPIDEGSVHAPSADAPAAGVTVTVDDTPIRVWTADLDDADYGPYQACFAGTTDAASLITHEQATTRANEASAIADEMKADVQESGATPVILLGDLASPSSADWTAANSDSHCGLGAVDWPVPDAFADAGLTDSYRAFNPDPTETPGITWSPIVSHNDEHDSDEPQDRVDYVWYAGEQLTIVDSSTLVTGWPTGDAPEGNAWTSDHAGVVTTFDVGEKSAPLKLETYGGDQSVEAGGTASDRGVQVTRDGVPVAGVTVDFAVSGPATFADAETAATATTDASGIARVPTLTTGQQAGTVTVHATAGDTEVDLPTITVVARASLSVSVTPTTQKNAKGLVSLSVDLVNDSEETLTISVKTKYGTKTLRNVAPGAESTVLIPSYMKSIAAGSVTVVAKTADGSQQTSTFQYEASN